MIYYKNVHHQVMLNIQYPPLNKICLFCKSDKTSFRYEEHLFPESLWNKSIILPPGVVCDECNNYFSRLENQFIHSYPGLFMRFVYVRATKKGKAPKTTLPQNTYISRKNPSNSIDLPTIQIQRTYQSVEELEQNKTMLYPDASRFSLPPIRLPDENVLRTSRLLAKIAMELLYLYAPQQAYLPKYDPIRNFARKAKEREGQYIPYAWCTYIGEPFTHKLIEMDDLYVFFTIPGAQYLYPLSQAHITPVFSFLAAQMNLLVEAHSQCAKPRSFNLNITRAEI